MIIELDTQSPQPLYEQLRNQIVFGIASGRLMPNEPLPSVRRLAADLGINLHTVNKAYSLLQSEGFIVMDRRKGALIASDIPDYAAYMQKLERELSISAAEAISRGMSEEAFVELCRDCFKKASRQDISGGQE